MVSMPVILQLPHFNQSAFSKSARFISKLGSFLNIALRGTSALGLTKRLQAQSRMNLDLCQGCYEIADKSSKVVPLGAPLFQSLTTKECAGIIEL